MALMPCVKAERSLERVDTASGRYLWVPDSLNEDVMKLKSGKYKLERKIIPGVNLDEKVTYQGDTIPMILKQRNLGRYDRGLFNYLFIPKGQWNFGLTASYGEFSADDLELLDLINDVDFSGHMFSIKPYISYFLSSNISVGVRLNYTSAKANVGSFKVDIDEDMNFNLHDISYRDEAYAISIFGRQYIGITRRGRFGVFNEAELSFSSGNSDFNRPFNSVLKNTHTTYMETRLTFSPGVSVFIMKNVSFNVSLGVFGFYLRNEKQWVDGESLGNRLTSGANFKFNIFNINFGLGVHI